MRYRMIASDLDDTLLDDNSEISARNKQAIRSAVDMGVKFVIATGRMFKTSSRYMQDLELECDWPLINYHGALVKTAQSKKIVLHRPLDNDLAIAIAEEAEAQGCHVSVFINDSLYVDAESDYSRYYQSLTNIPLDKVGKLSRYLVETGVNPSKISIIKWDGGIDETERYFKKAFNGRINALQSRPYFLEITDRLATKGQTLRWLAEQEGIKQEEIIAFGDGYNDLDMVIYAGLGVAVANARKEVLEAADLVTKSNSEHGVARVIEDYILRRPAG